MEEKANQEAPVKPEAIQNPETQTKGHGAVKRKISLHSKHELIHRRSLWNMNASVRTFKVKDEIEGLGFIYARTSEWGINFPEANGENQSPININSREAIYYEPLLDNPLTLNYIQCRETDICNNGNTIAVYLRYKPGDSCFRSGTDGRGDIHPRSTLSGGPLPKGDEYELAEFRFHWGREDARGSEHTVNFKAYPCELQLFHWNTSKFASLEEALGKPFGVAIISLFTQVGKEHSGLKILTDQLEDVLNKGRQKSITTAFNPNCLLPDPALRDYWTYPGSLTSPPCSEKVTWIIFRYPLTISHAQLEEFRRLRTFPKGETCTSGDGALVDNFRQTQQIYDRVIQASFQ